MQHLDPRAKWLFFFQSFISLFLVVVLIAGWIVPLFSSMNQVMSNGGDLDSVMSVGGGMILGALIVAILLGYLWAHLVYENYKYELTDIGFKKEEGVIAKKYTTIPYERIQNVDIHRSLVSRILGLSDLQIQTAGMSAPSGKYGSMEGRLFGLSQANAEIIRDELIKRSKGIQNQVI